MRMKNTHLIEIENEKWGAKPFKTRISVINEHVKLLSHLCAVKYFIK